MKITLFIKNNIMLFRIYKSLTEEMNSCARHRNVMCMLLFRVCLLVGIYIFFPTRPLLITDSRGSIEGAERNLPLLWYKYNATDVSFAWRKSDHTLILDWHPGQGQNVRQYCFTQCQSFKCPVFKIMLHVFVCMYETCDYSTHGKNRYARMLPPSALSPSQ